MGGLWGLGAMGGTGQLLVLLGALGWNWELTGRTGMELEELGWNRERLEREEMSWEESRASLGGFVG